MHHYIQATTEEDFTIKVCRKIVEEAKKSIDSKGSFTFVLSGGRTPKKIFQELASTYKETIEWEKVHFFWLDERCVKPTDKQSNYKLAYDYLISHISEVGSIHRIEGELEPEVAREKYKKDLLNFFGQNDVCFDFILLGMGEDGHVASLFPNSRELNLSVDIVLSTQKVYNGYRRVTLGLNTINQSSYKLLMLKGKEKMNIIDKNLNLPINKIKNKKIVYLI